MHVARSHIFIVIVTIIITITIVITILLLHNIVDQRMHQQLPMERPDLHGGYNGHFIHQRLQGDAHAPVQGDLLNTHLQALPLKIEVIPNMQLSLAAELHALYQAATTQGSSAQPILMTALIRTLMAVMAYPLRYPA